MVMALRALQALPQEKLGGVLELRRRVLHLAIPRDGRVDAQIARGGENLADKLVEGFVLQETVADPAMESISAALVRVVGAFVPQQRAPLVGKMVRVIAACKEPVDEV